MNELLLIIGILFFSSFIRSAFGFGDAMIAMPLLSMIIPVQVASPVIALFATSIAILILLKNWKQVKLESALKLIISTIIGIPIGLMFLKQINEEIVKSLLAILIICFSSYSLFLKGGYYLKNENWAYLFGLVAGILGGAYNTNGPPVVIYGNLRKWESSKFRATMQGYFLPTGAAIAIGHGIAGLWTKEVFTYYIWCLPAVILAIVIGGAINKKIPSEKFTRYIYFLLIILGIYLLINTWL